MNRFIGLTGWVFHSNIHPDSMFLNLKIMDQLKWDDSMSIKDATIDAQHKQLLKLTNELITNLNSGTAESQLRSIFNELLKYAKDHFSYEEQQFVDKGEPLSMQHIKEHDAFVATLIQLYGDMENSNEKTAERATSFLNSWIENHLKDTDKKSFGG